jgi:hypothetical protein
VHEEASQFTVSSRDRPTRNYWLAGPLGAMPHIWQPHVERLAERSRVLRYNFMDTPISGSVRALTIADLGADALALLDRPGVEQAAFCGLSVGGMVGIWSPAAQPDQHTHAGDQRLPDTGPLPPACQLNEITCCPRPTAPTGPASPRSRPTA